LPKIKITKREVDSLPFAEYDKQNFYWDTELKGFGLRVGSETKTFIAQRDINGKTRRINIGKYGTWTVEEARRIAREKLLKMEQGIDEVAEKNKKQAGEITLLDAWKIHKANMKNKSASKNTIDDYQCRIDTHLKHWQKRSLATITRADVRQLHTSLGENNGHYAANGSLRAFRAIYNSAMRENEHLPPNPCISIQWYKEYRRQEPIPEKELPNWYKEVQTIQNSVRKDYQLFVLFTGLRKTDSCTIEIKDIDFEEGTLHRPNPKGGKDRAFTIPLPDICVEIVKRRREENKILFGTRCPYLFPTTSAKTGDVIPLSEPKEQRRNIPTPHRLRDTYTTAANSAGLSPYDIEVLTNHRPAKSSVTAGYINQGIDHLRVQQQKVADYLKEKLNIG
jgi:integrase